MEEDAILVSPRLDNKNHRLEPCIYKGTAFVLLLLTLLSILTFLFDNSSTKTAPSQPTTQNRYTTNTHIMSPAPENNMVKVVVCGAAGGIGQPLSLLLKQSDLITDLALFDVVNAPGVAADLSHINTKSRVTGHGKEDMDAALKGAHTVVIPAGVPRKPGMTRDDLFKINAGIIRDLAEGVAKNCPGAYVLVISNPVNSTVPIVAEVLKKHGVFNPKKLFGISTLDVVRSSRFVSEVNSTVDPKSTRVTVVGGHSGVTIVPLLSHIPGVVEGLSKEQLDALVYRIQYGGDEVVKAKDGAGSATLSMAYAGARFALTLLEAVVAGKTGLVESTYVNLDADVESTAAFKAKHGVDYFALDVEFGKEGIKHILPLPKVSAYEQTLLDAAYPELKTNIAKGISFITGA
ncbi:MAG: malate dehydrogenase, NAD-dependent [Linnemannia gamsii]|nr:MAG: malate dehydrogenase, NAD-dependent [Linnemannia gamsii]